MVNKSGLRVILGVIGVAIVATKVEAIRIVEIQGEAEIKRDGKIQKAFLNTSLLLGDILYPKMGSKVIIDCGDKRKEAQAGIPSGVRGICPKSKDTDPRNDSDIFLKLLNQTMVYQTAVLENKPILRWPSLGEGNRYQVQLKFNDLVIWEKEVEGLQVRYEGVKPLRNKAYYDLVVKPLETKTEQEYQIRITPVEPFLFEEINQKVSAIKSEKLSNESTVLLLVEYYQTIDNEGLLWQAEEELEQVIKKGKISPTVNRLLGDIYLRLARNEEAQGQYLAAIHLAESEQNWQEWARGKEGLAHLSIISQNQREAQQLLQEAEKGYQMSGNQERRNVMKDWLVKIDDL